MSRTLRVLAVLAVMLALQACTAAEYRKQLFGTFRPLPVDRPVDATVILEAKVVEGFMDDNMLEAFRQIMAEELASMFTRPNATSGEEDFRVVAGVGITGVFPPTTVNVRVDVFESGNAQALLSSARSYTDSTFVGDVRMQRVANEYSSRLLPDIKLELLRAFENPLVLARKKSGRPDTEKLVARAKAAQAAGDVAGALGALRQAIQGAPRTPSAHVQAADLLIALCDPDGAVRILEDGVRSFTDAAELRTRLAAVQGRTVALPAADSAVCRAQAANREGVALARERNVTAALAKFEEAARLAPGAIPKAHYNAALVLEQQRRNAEAVQQYVAAQRSFLLLDDEVELLGRLVGLTQRAGLAAPESADARYRLGIVRARQRRYDEAVKELEAALAESPWLVDAYYNLGLVYEFTGATQPALRALTIYTQLAPTAPNVGTVKTKIVELKDRLGALGAASSAKP